MTLAQPTVTLSGTVKDNLANPFPGAEVQTTAGSTFTDSSGSDSTMILLGNLIKSVSKKCNDG
jgi:hypothetical protein